MIVDLNAILLALIASGGLWAYLRLREENRFRKSQLFQNHLMEEIKELKEKVDELLKDKHQLLEQIAELKTELAQTKAELHAVNTAVYRTYRAYGALPCMGSDSGEEK